MPTSTQKRADLSLSLALVIALVFIFIFILPLVACPLWGQVVQKKQLTPADYDQFGTLHFHNTTSDGQWASFSMVYLNTTDTVFVKNTSNKKNYRFAAASNASFLGNNNFVYQTNQTLHLLNLDTGKEHDFLSVKECYATTSGPLIVLTGTQKSETQLLVVEPNGTTAFKINGVEQFQISLDQKKIMYVTQSEGLYSLGVLDLGKNHTTRWIIQKSPDPFKMLTWEKTGKSLAFLSVGALGSDKDVLFYYLMDTRMLYRLDPDTLAGFPKDKTLDNQGAYAISISKDLGKVFFGLRPKKIQDHNLLAPITEPSPSVELWNANDKWIYPMEQKKGQFDRKATLAQWMPLSGSFLPVTSAELPKVMLAGNEQYALLSSPKAYEPQYDTAGPRDFYIMDLNTGKKELFLKKQPVLAYNIVPTASPQGRYVTYFRENNWWVYDIRSKTHTNVTAKIKTPFIGKENGVYNDAPYGNAGWTSDEKELILYDQYDIWKVKADGSQFSRITRGREKQMCFRIPSSGFIDGLQINYHGWKNSIISMQNGFLLEARGSDGKTGYFLKEKNKEETPLIYKASYVDKLASWDKAKSYIYREQEFDQSPRLMLQKGKIATVFFQSNPQMSIYQWGSSELTSYTTPRGEKLPAILYYPAGYNPEKKYPMIVHVYERQANGVYKYYNPSLNNEDGYNPAVLTSLGYFVLCPDIIRKDRHEGQSALDYTVSATREIIARGIIDSTRIGLMGHSFGGYQTNYIITQTGLFAAAVAGSAINNITGYYLSVDWKTGFPTMNAFQSGQLKMVQSPYEIPEVYTRNSPISYAAKITTPLLSFTGKEDYHVNWQQSVELYLELRRLNKKHIMLVYPNEGHALIDPSNQKDLSLRIQQWFGYYLKNEAPASWITDGVK